MSVRSMTYESLGSTAFACLNGQTFTAHNAIAPQKPRAIEMLPFLFWTFIAVLLGVNAWRMRGGVKDE